MSKAYGFACGFSYDNPERLIYFTHVLQTFMFIFSQDGYADGVSDGRDAVFQREFDKGYADGFAESFLQAKTDRFIQDSRKHCKLCLNPDLTKKSVEEVRNMKSVPKSK